MDKKFNVRAIRNTANNMRALVAIGEKKSFNDYHILRSPAKLALVTHYEWETCDFCNADCDENGVIDMAE